MGTSERTPWRRYVGPNGTRRRVRALLRRLEKSYGPFVPKTRRSPLDGLVLTILSQATNDRNSGRAFARLKERFETWDALLDAPTEELEEAIKLGGLARNKSRTIRKVLETLRASSGGLPPTCRDPLLRLAEFPLDEAMVELTSLPGVGIKTAACVLMFCLGRPVMPVDTHVHRLAGRLGLVRQEATADQSHLVLMAITPEELVYPFHIWLIAHGREVCRARAPGCDACGLSDLCPSVRRD